MQEIYTDFQRGASPLARQHRIFSYTSEGMAGYGELIRVARERKGLRQYEAAERIGVSASTLSNWENGFRPPEVEYIDRIVLALSLSPEALLQAMGVSMTPPAASRLPRDLILGLLAAPPDVQAAVQLLLDGWRNQSSVNTAPAPTPSASQKAAQVPRETPRGGYTQP